MTQTSAKGLWEIYKKPLAASMPRRPALAGHDRCQLPGREGDAAAGHYPLATINSIYLIFPRSTDNRRHYRD